MKPSFLTPLSSKLTSKDHWLGSSHLTWFIVTRADSRQLQFLLMCFLHKGNVVLVLIRWFAWGLHVFLAMTNWGFVHTPSFSSPHLSFWLPHLYSLSHYTPPLYVGYIYPSTISPSMGRGGALRCVKSMHWLMVKPLHDARFLRQNGLMQLVCQCLQPTSSSSQ